MRFKPLVESIFQEQNDDIGKTIRQLKSDCKYFFDTNRQLLESGFFLYRGSLNDYDVVYKESRKRLNIKGNKYSFYYYEENRPSNAPSRVDLVPCSGGGVSEKFEMMNKYIVFPVGSKYKMVYSDGIQDFNFNDLKDKYSPVEPKNSLKNAYHDNKNDMPKEFSGKVFDFMNKMKYRIGSRPDRIMNGYDEIMSFIENNATKISKYMPKVLADIDDFNTYMKEYLANLHVTQKLTKDMDGLEVGLYAPDGFYYISNEVALEYSEILYE